MRFSVAAAGQPTRRSVAVTNHVLGIVENLTRFLQVKQHWSRKAGQRGHPDKARLEELGVESANVYKPPCDENGQLYKLNPLFDWNSKTRNLKPAADEKYREILRQQCERMTSGDHGSDEYLEEGAEEEKDDDADDPEFMIENATAEDLRMFAWKRLGPSRTWEFGKSSQGETVTSMRGADVDIGDEEKEEDRSRLVARRLNKKSQDDWNTWSDFFASMPPITVLHVLFTTAVTRRIPGLSGKLVSQPCDTCFVFANVQEAHFW